MIDIKRLKLFPFGTNSLAITDEDGINYNVIFYPENSSFGAAYPNLKLQRRFVRYGGIAPFKLPLIIVNPKLLVQFRANRLIPVREMKSNVTNAFIDMSVFFDALDKKYEKGNYRRPLVYSKIWQYFDAIKNHYPDRKNVLLYYVDLSKPIPENYYYKRSFPLLMMFRSKDPIPFDYVMLAVNDSGSVKYYMLKNPEKGPVSFARFFALVKQLKTIAPVDELGHKEQENETTSDNVTNTIQANHEQENLGKETEEITGENALADESTKENIKAYLQVLKPEERSKIVNATHVSVEDAQKIALTSLIYGLTRDKVKAQKITASIQPARYASALQTVKKELQPEILEADKYKNESRDVVFSHAQVNAVNDNKNPSRILNKRKVDFKDSFEDDLFRSFKLLEKQERFPLKIIKFSKEKIPVDPGDLEPTKMIKYKVDLKGDGNRIHHVEINIPEIQDDGTFLINGKKKYLIYQIIIDPIFFLKPGEAELQTMYATVATHLKKTKHKKYFVSRIGGFWLPSLLLLMYHVGFDKALKLFGLSYEIVDEKPKTGIWLPMADGKVFIFKTTTNTSEIAASSMKEISGLLPVDITKSKDAIRDLIIRITGNRNCVSILDAVLRNIMEPVAVQVLKSKLLPTTFEGCISYICNELANGRTDRRNDVTKQRIRSSEIFNDQIQSLILGSYTDYRIKREHGDASAVYYCDTRNIVQEIVNSKLMQDMENINPYEELSCLTRITPVGPGALEGKRSVSKPHRNIDESYYGNIDPMDTPENENVGIINHLTIDAAIGNARGSFGSFEPVDIGPSVLSSSTVTVPFIGSCDGNRVMMGGSQTRQAIPIIGTEQPICQTGYETIMTSMLTDSYIKKSPVDGRVIKVTENIVVVQDEKNRRVYKIPLDNQILNSAQGRSSLNYFTAVVKEGARVRTGQILAEGKHIKDGVISVGTNLLAAIMGWKGYSFEDGYIISEKVAGEKLVSEAYDEITVFVKSTSNVKFIVEEGIETKRGDPLIIRSSKEVEELLEVEEDELIEGQYVKASPGGKVIAIEIYPNISISRFPILVPAYEKFKAKYEELHDKFPDKFLVNEAGNKVPFSGIKIVFKIERYDKCTLGDKFTNNHGGKGVLTLIEKTENMPITPWGDPIDIILNPIAIINRMNPSTLFEMYIGLVSKFAAKELVSMGLRKTEKALRLLRGVYQTLDMTHNKVLSTNIINAFRSLSDRQYAEYIKNLQLKNYVLPIIIPPFQAPSKQMIQSAMNLVGAKNSYKLKLPEFGITTRNPVSVGYLYYKKLEQQSSYKVHARSIGKYSETTAQPVSGGTGGAGGQKLSEFDTWAIAAHGCDTLLKELLGPLSDDIHTKNQILSDIIRTGEAKYRKPAVPSTKRLLDILTAGMMLEVKI
jgi:DNA-directed RNA polymerase beta subunit